MKEYLSAGEMAKIFDMDVQLLRYYDAKGFLVPEKRNPENNRRSYHFDQIYPLATIRYLRKLGYPLQKIQKFIYADNLEQNVDMLVEQAALLRRQSDELLATINIIQEKLRFIEKESAQSRKGQFHIKTYPDRQFVHVGEELNLFTHELFYFYPTVGFYENGQKWFGAYLFEEGESVPNIHESAKIDIIPGGAYLCGYHYGNYQTIQDSIHALYEYGKGQALDSCVVTLNIIDQFVEGHPANYITALEARILTP